MRLLIIGINYSPELTGIGPYTAGLAEHLVARGDQVTVQTGLPHYPTWRVAPGANRSLFRRETINGVTVIRCAHYVPMTQTALRRAIYEATFGLTALVAGLRSPRFDAILGVVPSLSGGILARLTGRRLGTPYGLLFQDLMSQAAVQSGIDGGGGVAMVTAKAEVWAVSRASAVGIVAQSFTPHLASLGVSPERIHHVPNWTRPVTPVLTADEVRTRFGWMDDVQVVLHAGNLGLKQGLEQVVGAARIAADRGDAALFVFSGGGNQEGVIRAAAKDLPNVRFLGVQPDGIHASLLAAADVLLLSERATQLDMSLPSKLTSYFAAARPIVAMVPSSGGSADEIRRSRAGLIVPAGEPGRLLEALARLRAEPTLAARFGVAGPEYARTHTSEAACLVRATDLVDAIAGSTAGEPRKSWEPAA
jgi:colanic acid biosynthesis glycosyl transferase WcaI